MAVTLQVKTRTKTMTRTPRESLKRSASELETTTVGGKKKGFYGLSDISSSNSNVKGRHHLINVLNVSKNEVKTKSRKSKKSKPLSESEGIPVFPISSGESIFDFSKLEPKIPYPPPPSNVKSLSNFALLVYRLTTLIPCGRITTYGLLNRYISNHPPTTDNSSPNNDKNNNEVKKRGNSSQAIGQALRRNPFAPRVPCHRVIASDLKIGGFMGCDKLDIKDVGGEGDIGNKVRKKLEMLANEGIPFDDMGKLLDKSKLWDPSIELD